MNDPETAHTDHEEPMVMVAESEMVMFMEGREEAYVAGDSVALGDML